MLSKSLASSVVLISLLSLFSKILGFLREGVVAYYFGTSHEADIFFLVFGIYNYVTAAIGMSLGISYLPIFVKCYSEKGRAEAMCLTLKFVNQLLVVFLFISLLAYCFSGNIALLIAPTYSEESLLIVNKYIKLLSLVLYFTMISFVFFDVLNGERKFGIRQLTGMLFNIISILFLVLYHQSWGIDSLIYSVLVASICQFAILFMFIFRKRCCIRFERIFCFSETKKIYISFVSVFLGTGVWFLRNIIDRVISSSLETGSVSALNYSGTLFSLVNTLIIASIVTVFYTELSEQYISKKYDLVSKTLNNGIVYLCMMLCPLAVFCIVCSSDIITVLLCRGQFSHSSVSLTSITFSMYIIGTPFYAIRDILTRYCYAISDKKTPVFNSIIAVFVNIPLSLLLSKYWGVGGITLASSFVSILLTVMLFVNIRKKSIFLNFGSIHSSLIKILVASIFTAFVLYFLNDLFLKSFSSFLRILLSGVECALLYSLLLYLLKCRDFVNLVCKINLKKYISK